MTLCEWSSFLSELPGASLNSLNSKALSYNLDVPKIVEYCQAHMKSLARKWETKTKRKVCASCAKAPTELKWPWFAHNKKIKHNRWNCCGPLKLFFTLTLYSKGFPSGTDGKESACNAGDLSSILGMGRSPGEGNDNPLQYSCLENSMGREVWQAIVQGSQRVRHDWMTKHTYTVNTVHWWIIWSILDNETIQN